MPCVHWGFSFTSEAPASPYSRQSRAPSAIQSDFDCFRVLLPASVLMRSYGWHGKNHRPQSGGGRKASHPVDRCDCPHANAWRLQGRASRECRQEKCYCKRRNSCGGYTVCFAFDTKCDDSRDQDRYGCGGAFSTSCWSDKNPCCQCHDCQAFDPHWSNQAGAGRVSSENPAADTPRNPSIVIAESVGRPGCVSGLQRRFVDYVRLI